MENITKLKGYEAFMKNCENSSFSIEKYGNSFRPFLNLEKLMTIQASRNLTS